MSQLRRQYTNWYYREINNHVYKESLFKPSVYAKHYKLQVHGFEPNGIFPITRHDSIGFRARKKHNTTKRRMKRIRRHAA